MANIMSALGVTPERTVAGLGPDLHSGLLVGMRIPKHYFVARGVGESDITIHAGSYHLALKDAGIERCNIMTYSSIMPAIAEEIEPPALTHGAVMETIMAVAHTEKRERVSAGIVYGWLSDRVTGERYGGLVCEHNGPVSEDEIERLLHASLQELYTNGFSDDYELGETRVLTSTMQPRKQYGTALVALCFTSYVYPLVGVHGAGWSRIAMS